jgi:iron complex transport system substrate-binding protein
MRIVSLSPAATEIVVAIGLGRKLVGISHDSDRPTQVLSRPVVTRPTARLAGLRSRTVHRRLAAAAETGTPLIALDEAAVARVRPDLVLTHDLGDPRAVTSAAARDTVTRLGLDAAVVGLEPSSIEGLFHSISTVGAMAGAEAAAMRLVERMRGRLSRIERKVQKRREAGRRPVRVVALEWLDPPSASGLWVPEQVRRAGGWDVLGRDGERSVATTWRAVREVDPEMLVLMPRGLGVHEAVAEWARTRRPSWWARLEAARRGQVFVVDGEAYYGRPGPRIVDGISMLAEIFDPDAFVDTSPVAAWTPVE